MLTCIVCQSKFERRGTSGPIPKYCSQPCITKAKRTPHRREYERLYRNAARAAGKLDAYTWRYNRRPEVKARNRERMRLKWNTDEEYRQRQLRRLREYIRKSNTFANVDLPAPYSGHMWMEKVRQLIAPGGVDESAPWTEDRYDEMGEALLALLEGKDPKQAIRDYRKREYVSRYLTTRWSEFKMDDDDDFSDWFMPKEESAEDWAIAREEVSIRKLIPSKFYRKGGMSRHMKHRTQQPRRRRMKDGKSWQKHL